jgi:hypothetical protein
VVGLQLLLTLYDIMETAWLILALSLVVSNLYFRAEVVSSFLRILVLLCVSGDFLPRTAPNFPFTLIFSVTSKPFTSHEIY